MRKLIVFLAGIALALASYADLQLAALFSDGMVLQRDQRVPIWGWTTPGDEVTVIFGAQEHSATAEADGKFTVQLNPLDACAVPASLTVRTATATTVLENVLVGEVWLCSGQSNMCVPVSRAKNFKQEQAAANFPNIRLFMVERLARNTLQKDTVGSWRTCTPDKIANLSAVAYFFGRELHQELGVPVGLVHSAWGGTCVEAWSPMASLNKFPSVMAYKEEFDHRAEQFASNGELAADQALEQWKDNVIQAKAAGEKIPKKPKKPTAPHRDQNYPANLYNGMINPIVPYAMRGAIWYQGERNAKTSTGALLYRDLLENLVLEWRKDWNSDFPFYAVQLVNYKKPTTEPVQDSAWAFIRESFLRFHKEVPNAEIVVGIDVGEEKDIHPADKQTIGFRLAQQALANTYHRDVVEGGPIYQSMQVEGHQIAVSFKDPGSGLAAQDGAALQTFAIAGDDRVFVKADAVIDGDRVVVSAASVAHPVAVRYAWANNPAGCNLANQEGFPASPFRTDDWPSTGE